MTQTNESLERSVAQAQQKLAQLRELQRAARTQVVLLVLVIVAIMLVFGFQTYSRVRANFAFERMQAAFAERLPRVGQQMQSRAINALREAAPTYQELAAARLKEIAPQLREKAETRFSALPEALHAQISEQLHASANRVAVSIQQRTKTKFPYLADQRAEALVEQFAKAIDRQSNEFVAYADKLFTQEAARVGTILTHFEPVPVKDTAEIELEKKFAHELLMWVDYEVQAIGTADELNMNVPVKSSE